MAWYKFDEQSPATVANATGTITGPAAALTPTAESEATNLVTVTVNNSYAAGQNVTISGTNVAGYSGNYVVASAAAGNFTYNNPVAGIAAGTTPFGSVTSNNVTGVGTQFGTAINAGDLIIVGQTTTANPQAVLVTAISSALNAQTFQPLVGAAGSSFSYITNTRTAGAGTLGAAAIGALTVTGTSTQFGTQVVIGDYIVVGTGTTQQCVIITGINTATQTVTVSPGFEQAVTSGASYMFVHPNGGAIVNSGSAGPAFNGTLQNATGGPSLYYVAGAVGTSALFSGSTSTGTSIADVDGYVDVPNFSWSPGSPVTVSFWAFTPGISPQEFTFGVGAGGQTQRFSAHLGFGDQQISWDYGDFNNGGRIQSAAGFIGGATMPFNTWNHVVFVAGGASSPYRAIYVNGNLVVANYTGSSGPSTGLSSLQIFRSLETPLTTHNRGGIDDFRVYNRVLGPNEIATLANKQEPSNATITKTGPGTVVFSGTNTYSCNLNINAGVLSVSSDSNLGTALSAFPVTGTVATGANSTTITGTNTQFTNQLNVGDTINIAGTSPTAFTIQQIQSATVLIVTSAPTSAVSGVVMTVNRSPQVGLNGGTLLASGSFTSSAARPYSINSPTLATSVDAANGATLTINGPMIGGSMSFNAQPASTGSILVQSNNAVLRQGQSWVMNGRLTVPTQSANSPITALGASTVYVNGGATFELLTNTVYPAGTITVAASGTAVTGNNTAFMTGGQLAVGDALYVIDDQNTVAVQNITAISADNALTIGAAFGANTITAKAFAATKGIAAVPAVAYQFANPIVLLNNATLQGTGSNNGSILNSTITVAEGAQVTIQTSSNPLDIFRIGNAANELAGGGNGAQITVAGAGRTHINTDTSAYIGNWSVNPSGTAAALMLQTAAGLGGAQNTVTVNSSALFGSFSAVTIANPIVLNGGTIGSTGAAPTFSGPVSVNANSTISTTILNAVAGQNVTFSGPISGTAGLTLFGKAAATVILNNPLSTYSGTITGANNFVTLQLNPVNSAPFAGPCGQHPAEHQPAAAAQRQQHAVRGQRDGSERRESDHQRGPRGQQFAAKPAVGQPDVPGLVDADLDRRRHQQPLGFRGRIGGLRQRGHDHRRGGRAGVLWIRRHLQRRRHADADRHGRPRVQPLWHGRQRAGPLYQHNRRHDQHHGQRRQRRQPAEHQRRHDGGDHYGFDWQRAGVDQLRHGHRQGRRGRGGGTVLRQRGRNAGAGQQRDPQEQPHHVLIADAGGRDVHGEQLPRPGDNGKLRLAGPGHGHQQHHDADAFRHGRRRAGHGGRDLARRRRVSCLQPQRFALAQRCQSVRDRRGPGDDVSLYYGDSDGADSLRGHRFLRCDHTQRHRGGPRRAGVPVCEVGQLGRCDGLAADPAACGGPGATDTININAGHAIDLNGADRPVTTVNFNPSSLGGNTALTSTTNKVIVAGSISVNGAAANGLKGEYYDSPIANTNGALRMVQAKQLNGSNASLTMTGNHLIPTGQGVHVQLNPPDPNFDGVYLCTGAGSATATINYVSTGNAAIPTAVTQGTAFGVFKITTKSIASNVVSLVTGDVHSLRASQSILVASGDPVFDGAFNLTVAAGTGLSYAKTNPDVASTPAAFNVTNEQIASKVATLTIGAHGFSTGQAVFVTLGDPQFDGVYALTGVTATTISYARNNPDVASAPVTGTVNGTLQVVPDGTRIDPQVYFGFANPAIAGLASTNDFTVRWTGFVEAPYTDTYTFFTQGDDGSRVVITPVGGTSVQATSNDYSTGHGVNEVGPGAGAVTIPLTAGQRVALDHIYEQGNGGEGIALLWASPLMGKQVIPQSALTVDGPVTDQRRYFVRFGARR